MGVHVSKPPRCSIDRASYVRGHGGGHHHIPPRQSSGCGLETVDQRERKLKKEERLVIKSGLPTVPAGSHSPGGCAVVCPTESLQGFTVVCSAWRAGWGGEGPRAFSKMKSAIIVFFCCVGFFCYCCWGFLWFLFFFLQAAECVLRLFLWFLPVGNHWAYSEIEPTSLGIGCRRGRRGYPSTGLKQWLPGTLKRAFP